MQEGFQAQQGVEVGAYEEHAAIVALVSDDCLLVPCCVLCWLGVGGLEEHQICEQGFL